MKLYLLIFSLCFLQNISLAGDSAGAGLIEGTTNFAYKGKEHFCSEKAKEKFQELDAITKVNVTKINDMIKKINELKAKKVLIADYLKIRDEFLEASAAIKAEDDQKKEQDAIKKQQSIIHFRKLLQTSLSLSAINILAKQANSSNKNVTLASLCESSKSLTNFCNYIKMDHDEILPNHSMSILNKTFQNAQRAFSEISNEEKEKVKNEIISIYDSIPSVIAPDKMLLDLGINSPQLKACLNVSDNQSETSCEQIMNPDHSSDIKNKLINEMSTIHKKFSDDNLDPFFATRGTLPTQHSESYIQNVKNIKEKAKKIEELLKTNDKPALVQIDADKISALKENCTNNDIQKCIDSTNEMITQFKEQDEKIDKEISTLETELNTFSGNFGQLQTNEKLKQYLAQKYLRICTNPKQSDVTSSVLTPTCNTFEVLNTDSDATALGQLSMRVSGIIDAMTSSAKLSSDRGEVGPFSKDELRSYQTYCQTDLAKADKKYTEICHDVQNATNSIAKIKESKEWVEFSKTHWIENNPYSKNGYDVVKKRSNGSLIAEAFGKSMTNFLPIWMGDLQMQSQIEIMGSQALYQKQLNYMYDPNSPWMAPYFQTDYYSGFNTGSMVLGTPGFGF